MTGRIYGLLVCCALAAGACSGKVGVAPLTGTAGTAGTTGTAGTSGINTTCGNGHLDSGEDCEGGNLNGGTCTSIGFQGGTLACAASCRYDTSACTGPLTLAVNPSRTTCTAPCAVFFDATGTTGLMGGDYVGANFSWDFDSTNVDPMGAHEQTIGFVTAHVFEVPGTYQVSVRVRDLAGHAGSTTVPITVAAMGGSTIYVAANGNDKNPGTTMAQPLATLTAALTHSAAQVSILLRRGDTFSLSKTVSVSVKGPFLLGAYTDPSTASSAAPVLSTTATNMLTVTGSQDVRVTDLHLLSSGGVATTGIRVDSSSHTLVERVELEGLGNSVSGGGINLGIDATANPVFFVDCHEHTFAGYGLYGDKVSHFAMIGTTIDDFGGGEHGVRIQGGTGSSAGQLAIDSYFAENTVLSNDTNGAVEGFTFRGDDQNIVCVNNHVNRVCDFAPQNASGSGSNEHVSNALLEGNLLYDPRPPSYAYETGFIVTAQHVVVRNNIFVNSLNAIAVQGQDPSNAGTGIAADWVDQVSIYNNIHYVLPPTGGDIYKNNNMNSIVHVNTTGSLIAQNNIFVEGVPSAQSSFLVSDHKGTDTVDHNLMFAPKVSGTLPAAAIGAGGLIVDPLFIATDPTGANAFHLSPGSPAIDVGAMVPVYQDLVGAARPVGSGWDLGPFEYTP